MDVVIPIILIAMAVLAVWGFFDLANRGDKKQSIEASVRSLEGFEDARVLQKTQMLTGIPFTLAISRDERILIGVGDARHVLGLSKLLAAELRTNGRSITTTSRPGQVGGALVGAAIAGPVGALIGGLSAKQTTSPDVSEVSLVLLFDDEDVPIFEVPFIEMTSTGATPGAVALREAQGWFDLLKVLLHRAEQGRASTTAPTPAYGSLSEELDQLADLRDRGVLSEEEFAAAKSRLLDLPIRSARPTSSA